MPRRPPGERSTRVYPYPRHETISGLLSPLTAFSRCESPAFIRQGLRAATEAGALPSAEMLAVCVGQGRSRDHLLPLEATHYDRQATLGASYLRNARVFLDQARAVHEAVRPIPYYYGGLSYLEFITACLVRREVVGSRGHGLSVTCDSEGEDFDGDWPRRKCRVEMGAEGDFAFLVDVLTVGQWPSLFSGFRLHRDTKNHPYVAIPNPAPLLRGEKLSLDILCNFDLTRYVEDSPGLGDWVKGGGFKAIWHMTSMLLDFPPCQYA